MQPARMIFEDTPAFIPVPFAMQHRRSEVIVWPLDPDDKPVMGPASAHPLPSLAEFRSALPRQETSSGQFFQSMRDGDRF